MAATADDNPLLKALPPATDYITYLTIIEYNINKDLLPTLHDVLQDTTLTTNIGWDLVHLLIPLLPASEQCLQDIARLGNPREVVLKVTELLESIGLEDLSDDDEEEPELDSVAATGDNANKSFTEIDGSLNADDKPAPKDYILAAQFDKLLGMLSILHPRIKTQFPSRFLTTALQAIVPAFARVSHVPLAIKAVLNFSKTLANLDKPPLPPRASETIIASSASVGVAPDPEDRSEPIAPEERGLQKRLLASFLTYIVEGYVNEIPPINELSGLAWTERYQEKQQPEKGIPGRPQLHAEFQDNVLLRDRDTTIVQILSLARLLGINHDLILNMITEDPTSDPSTQDCLGIFPFNYPPSSTGLLYLCAAHLASSVLLSSQPMPRLNSSWHASLLSTYIGSTTTDTIGTEPISVTDSTLFLGWATLPYLESIPEATTFSTYLHRLSLVSANTSSSRLRYSAHLLLSTILHAHPDPSVRLYFIRDTLQHCPYESLKVSAVGWLKTELLKARSEHEHNPFREPDLFQTPSTLGSLAPSLFPSTKLPSDLTEFQLQIPVYLAVLNLLYLLSSSPGLRESLNILGLCREHRIVEGFLDPLGKAARQFGTVGNGNLERDGEDFGDVGVEMQLVEDTVGWVKEALVKVQGNDVNGRMGGAERVAG